MPDVSPSPRALRERVRDAAGYSTAELLGNAALAVAALVVIWAAIQGLGEDLVDWIGAQLMN